MTTRVLTWLPPAIALGLFTAASVVTAIYYGDTTAISYPTPITWELLWAHRAGINSGTLREAWSTGFYEVAFVVTTAAWPMLMSRGSHRAACLAAALPIVLLFPVSLLGGYVAFVDLVLRPGWDGETLAEGWPLTEVYGLWSLWAMAFLAYLVIRRTPHAAPGTGMESSVSDGAA